MIRTRPQEQRSLRTVEPAELVSFRYRNSDREHSDRDVLVMAYDDEKELLHALDLDKFSDENLVNTAREIANQSQEESDFEEQFDENNRIFLPDVLDSEMEQWYETEYSADRYEDNPYRTFRKDRIRNLRVVEVAVI